MYNIRQKNIDTFAWCPTIEEIASAPIARYTLKDDSTNRMRLGSIAQYWQKTMPETVTEGSDGVLSMDSSTIALVNVIALAREVKRLKAEIIRLKNR